MSNAEVKNLSLLQQPSAQPGRKVVIAVDGPAASGKGTLARKIAERLGYAYLDTGTLYRAVAFATLEMAGDPTKIEDVKPAIDMIKRNLTQELLANAALRTPQVAAASSKVAALPQVRSNLLTYQRSFAENPPEGMGGAVLDGRDIGTVVCPQADVKFFITASAEERARRRFNELKKMHSSLTLEAVLADIEQRDLRDSTRADAPTKAAAEAYVIDTTNMTPEQVMEEAAAIIQSAFLKAVSK